MNAKNRRNAEKFGSTIGERIPPATRLAATSRAPLSPAPSIHVDDLAVDALAAMQRLKLARCRAKGRRGWDNPLECSVERLAMLLGGALAKGDPIDIANYAAMLHARGAAHRVIAEQAMRALLRHVRDDQSERIEQLERENDDLLLKLRTAYVTHRSAAASGTNQSHR